MVRRRHRTQGDQVPARRPQSAGRPGRATADRLGPSPGAPAAGRPGVRAERAPRGRFHDQPSCRTRHPVRWPARTRCSRAGRGRLVVRAVGRPRLARTVSRRRDPVGGADLSVRRTCRGGTSARWGRGSCRSGPPTIWQAVRPGPGVAPRSGRGHPVSRRRIAAHLADGDRGRADARAAAEGSRTGRCLGSGRRLRRSQIAVHPWAFAGGGRSGDAAGRRLGLSGVALDRLYRAGLVHDLGRLGVSNAIWDKAGQLGAGERERIRLYPYLTERILSQSLVLAELGALAVQHRERLDGSGYPRGLTAGSLPIAARILAVADAYQSLREQRPHRAALSIEQPSVRLRAEAGEDVWMPTSPKRFSQPPDIGRYDTTVERRASRPARSRSSG